MRELVLAQEKEFFRSLVESDLDALARVVADDFILIEVMRGAEVDKSALLQALGAGQLCFQSIKPTESRVRLYGDTAMVTGRTVMSGHFGNIAFTVPSRYTHVYVKLDGIWRLATAQGTQIAPEPVAR
jgi:ketosteroid isomerase-like protein